MLSTAFWTNRQSHQYFSSVCCFDLHIPFLFLSLPCQGRWGGPWKTLWRLVVGGSQGVWWPFHYSRSLPFHACPFPPSFPAEHLRAKGKEWKRRCKDNKFANRSEKQDLLKKIRRYVLPNWSRSLWSNSQNHKQFLCCRKEHYNVVSQTLTHGLIEIHIVALQGLFRWLSLLEKYRLW